MLTSMRDLVLPVIQNLLVTLILPLGAWIAYDQIFNRRSPGGALSAAPLPVTLKSDAWLLAPNIVLVFVGLVISGKALLVLMDKGGAIYLALLLPPFLFVLYLLWGNCFKLFNPTILKIDREGIFYRAAGRERSWAWPQINHAEVRKISGPKGISSYWIRLCLESGSDADLSSMLRSTYGVESAKSVCGLIQSVKANINQSGPKYPNSTR